MRVGRTREVRTLPMEELVLHNVLNSGVSSRHATRHRAVSHKNVLAILHVNAFYSYHLERVPGLQQADFRPR